ncbi:MAG: UDP-N-acetylmuramoylalanyl-D-glutamyl-2,6-diaminopimelate--D-alanyl-D-alanine ligase [Elioraea sp.]|nr:UDP-N-acetylmuramoylalanyl-D-glutamyl-2,6-diaminopimelate--D-alanyl-D-alanine ligase [Elioraea sp.]
MSALWTSAEIADAVGGRAAAPFVASGVSIDSRTLARGELFVALKGTRDGHDFVADALRKGAAGALVSRDPAEVAGDPRLIRVEDTLAALTALGRAGRARARATLIAVTGSVGKTGTKEALRHVLARQGGCHAAAASHNNAIGVPLTLARLPREVPYAAVEIGMNRPGEIAPLARLAAPHVAIITTVEAVHIAFFPHEEAIADEKASIMQGVIEGGAVVLNRDNRHFARLLSYAQHLGVARILTFGADPRADVRLLDWRPEGFGGRARASLLGQEIAFRLAAPGRHAAHNALAVLAAVFAAGADPFRAAEDLADLPPAAGRGQRLAIRLGDGEAILIDDSYNASPPSMRAAFAVLADALAARRVAVLGDMLELGERAEDEHRALAQAAAEARIDLVFCCGPLMRHLYEALPMRMRGAHAADSDALLPLLQGALQPGDVILVKGSLGSRMGRIVEALARPGG